MSGMLMGSLTGCKKPPEGALSDAERALLAAEARKDCSNDKYAAAQNLLAEARALVKEKKYDEAERKAIAAQKMAEQAKKTSDANWEECNKRKNVVAEATKPVDTTPKKPVDGESAELRTVFFAYDSSELTPAQRQQLEQNARWIRQNNPAAMVLEGHTDERGSDEYNIALGERRAQAARQYLIQLGVSEDSLRILSYGEEKPSAYGASEEDYRQNRRVEFVPRK